MHSKTLDLTTGGEACIVDLTSAAASFVAELGSGLVNVYVPHATAGVAIVETGAGSDTDTLDAIDRLLPRDPTLWRHEHGTPGHGRDHVLPAFIAPSITVPVIDGQLAMGVWQSICLVDTNVDNNRRTVRLSFIPG